MPASPIEHLVTLAGSYCVARALHVVADLGVADALDAGETADVLTLAERTGTNAEALGRVLRLLSSHGVFEARDGTVAHNEASRHLRADNPQSVRGLARMFGLPPMWGSFQAMAHSLRTGRPATEQCVPEGIWNYLAANPEAGAIFDQAMTGKAQAHVAGILAAYDFSRFAAIGDIGGGRGHLLLAIMAANPAVRGILFDQPQVVANALADAGGRLTLQGGDFFSDPLPVCDAYILMEVIHDWDDEQSLAILKSVASAAPAGSTLLIIEQLLGDDPGPSWAKMLDIHMLTLLGGKQRTREEYEALVKRAGFQRQRAVETFVGATILESIKV